MKATAQILKYRGRALKSAADMTGALEALMADLSNGDITPAEHRRIQNEINQKIRAATSALKTVAHLRQLEKLAEQLDKVKGSS
jgi:hypothetical protein